MSGIAPDGTIVSLSEEFRTRVERVGGKVYNVPHSRLTEQLRQLLAERGWRRIVMATEESTLDLIAPLLPALRELQPSLQLQLSNDPLEIAANEIGISQAVLGVAETGSLLFATGDRGRRLVAMLSPVHLVLLSTKNMVAGLDELSWELQRLSQTGYRYMSLVTGPSRTADIERVITIGVQGPRELHIFLINEDE